MVGTIFINGTVTFNGIVPTLNAINIIKRVLMRWKLLEAVGI